MSRHALASCALAALFSALLAAPAHPVPLEGGAGFDYFQGPGGQTTRTGLAIVGASPGVSTFTLALSRFDDSHVGLGNGLTLGYAADILPATRLCIWGSRFASDGGDFHAERVKLGPMLAVPDGPTAGLYYQHDRDNTGARSDAALAEAELPVSRVTARAALGFASIAGGPDAAQGTVGVGWQPVHGLELTGDVGVARNGFVSVASAPAVSSPIPLPILGNGRPGSTTTRSGSRNEGVAQLGVRFQLP